MTKHLSIDSIERSVEISDWLSLSQFSGVDRNTMISILSHLTFVSRDEYSVWFEEALQQLMGDGSYALYAVRKLESENGQIRSYFDSEGKVIKRPGQAQGSEDFVYSLIRNAARLSSPHFLDHPGLGVLKKNKVRSIVLIDDSIGSGGRVSEFISAMMASKTLMSWWSYGLFQLHILSYARTREGQEKITATLPGSNHKKREHPRSTKVRFSSHAVYAGRELESRWGSDRWDILGLCDSVTKIQKKYRRGYGGVMANLVFYHSVPNNIPGMLYYKSSKWTPLFPERVLPQWLRHALERDQDVESSKAWAELTKPMIELLALTKKGVRNRKVLAQRMDRDEDFVDDIVSQAQNMGLLLSSGRITEAGRNIYYENVRNVAKKNYDYSLYLPSSWCADRETVQPSKCEKGLPSTSTDLIDPVLMSGEVGQASLERTDVKAPPFSIELHRPSKSRENLDTDGPSDLKK